jgi:alpha-L-fucosidase
MFNRIAGIVALCAAATVAQTKYEPNWESIGRHQVPEWFHDAKLGIFIHWGLYSVPAWAPPTGELGKVDWNKWFFQNPYAEWYLNTIRLKDTPSWEHHVTTYGADFDYYRFAETFNRENRKWKPEEWAKLFHQTGARYVVLTSKHHDGFTLWPSRVPNPKRPGTKLSAERDLVGDLTKAVRAEGMKMGLYYSGGLDWTFETTPIAKREQVRGTVPQTQEYGRYADAHWHELIDRYAPALLWNDISYPKTGKIPELFAYYLNKVPEGAINNRFGVDFADFTTPEYTRYDKITEKKWESCRGLGFSFGYNRVEGPEHVIASDKLIELVIDIVSKNGNLLLNVGPAPDGTISAIQMDRLRALGKWLDTNGEGIFGSRPWVTHGGKTPDGSEIRFTRKSDALYAFLFSKPGRSEITVPGVYASPATRVQWLGQPGTLKWIQKGRDLVVMAPARPPGQFALTLKITPLPQQPVKE